MAIRKFQNPEVMEKFLQFKGLRGKKLMELREIVFDVADCDSRIGLLSEQLRWGDPSYITETTQAGSTVRLGLFGANKIAIFFHCKTTLVDTFREIYSDRLDYSKNRAILIEPNKMPDKDILSHCIHMSLTYKLRL